MKNLLILTFLYSSLVQAQTFTIFENNKKNRVLFDYNDPNSLVSMLVQNQGLITSNGCTGMIFSNENKHSISGLKSFSCKGEPWEIWDDANGTMTLLNRDSDSEKFDDWYTRLTTQGSAPDYNPEVFTALTRSDKLILEKQYEACVENQALRQPDEESTYWVDYPNPAIYLQRNFETDSTGKFTTKFSQLLITERLDNKKGYSQKPQVLMAFGDTDNSINQEILDLLKEELMLFEMKQNFAWKKIISENKSRIIQSDELKKLIHCWEINEYGIDY